MKKKKTILLVLAIELEFVGKKTGHFLEHTKLGVGRKENEKTCGRGCRSSRLMFIWPRQCGKLRKSRQFKLDFYYHYRHHHHYFRFRFDWNWNYTGSRTWVGKFEEKIQGKPLRVYFFLRARAVVRKVFKLWRPRGPFRCISVPLPPRGAQALAMVNSDVIILGGEKYAFRRYHRLYFIQR